MHFWPAAAKNTFLVGGGREGMLAYDDYGNL
jgi:hypothetical protein